MATIYNSELFEEIQSATKLQVSRDAVPTQLAEKVVPVIDVNPKMLRRNNVVESASAVATGTLTVYTTPTDKDFYLTSVSVSIIKDAAVDTATGYYGLNIPIFGGATKVLMRFPIITLTAQTMEKTLSLTNPIKLARGLSINMPAVYGAGVMVRAISITGYTVDNPTA